jgi:hypothetical protein
VPLGSAPPCPLELEEVVDCPLELDDVVFESIPGNTCVVHAAEPTTRAAAITRFRAFISIEDSFVTFD